MNNPNPGHRSPASIADDAEYEVMRDYTEASYWPSAGTLIARHRQTGTFWRAVYAVRDDDSDYEDPTTWTQVQPRQKVITEYVPVQK